MRVKMFSGVLPGVLIVILIVAGALLYWQTQGGFFSGLTNEGKIISEIREVSGFNRVSVSGSGLVILDQGQEETLKIEAGENIMEYITTEVSGNELKIDYKNMPRGLRFSEVKFYLTVKELEKFVLSGSAKLEGSKISANELELTISGSGRMAMTLEVESLKANIDGSGKFELEGTAGQQQIATAGSGNFYGKDLAGKEADVNLAGSGRAEVNVSDKLDVTISGSGKIYYLGEPAMGKVNISGSGKIEKL
jgi:hypothetical protein